MESIQQITFEDLVNKKKEDSQEPVNDEKFKGYQETSPIEKAIIKRQKSCFIKELPSDEVPDFWKKKGTEYLPDFTKKNRMTIKQIIMKDIEDESLQKYKQQLLGDLHESCKLRLTSDTDAALPPLVEIIEVEVMCEDRFPSSIKLNLTTEKDSQMYRAQDYILRESSTCQLRVTFKVYNDIVYGLKYCNVVKKNGLVVEKYEEVMGTFAPTSQLHVFELTPEETPKGFFARGKYRGKSMFIDNDGNVHMQFEYTFHIKKTWD